MHPQARAAASQPIPPRTPHPAYAARMCGGRRATSHAHTHAGPTDMHINGWGSHVFLVALQPPLLLRMRAGVQAACCSAWEAQRHGPCRGPSEWVCVLTRLRDIKVGHAQPRSHVCVFEEGGGAQRA